MQELALTEDEVARNRKRTQARSQRNDEMSIRIILMVKELSSLPER